MTKLTRDQVERLLSERELEVLERVAKGLSRNKIAESMSISVLTYDQHRKNIRAKLQLKSKADWALILVSFME
jgi:DNA-binding CsgD family transcriptional regulator